MIFITINGIKKKVKKNITILQACDLLNIEIPRFCFQENLKIAGNCRMCLVEVENSPKPVAACAMPISNNMKIYTNSPLVQKARESVLEFLLLNHPLDCPICDQASECDLQDQTMLFGSDKSRFFLSKRCVEDKNCGPFIKTIMTRCIHCTRCVRFSDEICNIDNLGTTGRGKSTEINFYDTNIFKSEFSGNLIDLCPVGALTSKPYAFKARSWELKKKEAIDILDGIGSNINVNTFQNEILRILPKNNFYINKEWISNKTRFFFDSLKYQRLEYPLIKINNKFKKISWLEAFKIINKKLLNNDSSKNKIIIGNTVDLKSLYFFKKNLNQLGISNISYLNLDKNNKINTDITSNFLFNNTLKSIENNDLCLIINSDIRSEGSILNIYLINRLKKGNFKIANIGSKLNYTYPVMHLGTSIDILVNIIKGKHSFCKILKKSKNPLIIIGNNILLKKNGYFIIEKLKNLSFLKKENLNFLSTQSSYLNFLEIFNSEKNKKIKNFNLYYLFNTYNLKKNIFNKNNFIIYQGHHFTEDAQKSNLILPGLTFLEKEGLYLNVEGFIQKNDKILTSKNNNQKNDINIFKYMFLYLEEKNKKKLKINFNFFEIYPYLNKKKLKITDNFLKNKKKLKINFNFLNILKKIYTTNLLEKYSNILMNSKKFFKNTSNFNI